MAVGLIYGTTIAIKAVSLNKGKTKAIAVANEKVEMLKAMDYENIGLTSDDPGWEMSYPELSENGYGIIYYSTWTDDVENSYKQVLVSVSSSKIKVPAEVTTRIYPALGETPELEPGYPSPLDLTFEDTRPGGIREIRLTWTAPETERVIARYNIYRDGELNGTSLMGIYIDQPGNDDEYIYYIIAVYDDDTESNPSISIRVSYYAAPQNLVIDGYTGSGSEREVILSWSTPESPYTFVEYRVYRNGSFIESTVNESYQDLIGIENYIYYTTITYKGGYESDPSNSETTE